jgi:cell wall-associated NlpC family hydrolase
MKAARLVTAARPAVDLHRMPSRRSEMVSQLRLGDVATWLGSATRGGRWWLRVAGRHDRYSGWADAAHLAPRILPGRRALPPGIRRSLVAQAFVWRGVRYLWGGTTPAGFDCSGFVQFLYRLHGVDLPRDAWLQAADRRLKSIRRSALRAGDLLFFHPQGKPTARISHVGMAISDTRFIHATTTGHPVVQVSRADDRTWASRVAGIRRLS